MMNKSKCWFFEKINKIDKTMAKLIRNTFLSKVGIEGNVLNLIKNIYQKSTIKSHT